MITMNQCHSAARNHVWSIRRAILILDRNSAGPTERFEVIALFERIILGGPETVYPIGVLSTKENDDLAPELHKFVRNIRRPVSTHARYSREIWENTEKRIYYMSFFKIYNRPILCSVSTFKTPFNNDTWRKSVYPRKHIKDDDGASIIFRMFQIFKRF